jgi:hypothetical protein
MTGSYEHYNIMAMQIYANWLMIIELMQSYVEY